MIFKYKFCLWLIDTLSVQPLTLPQIQKRWLNASANEDGYPLAERSFNRYRRQAESLMFVDIQCDKRDGNLYKIVGPDDFKNNELRQWLLSAFRVSSLAERVKNRADVMIENAPPSAYLLQDIMEGIEGKHPLRFVYKSHYTEAKDCELLPAFVRLFRQRWYVIGLERGTERTKTCALERMTNVEVLQETFKLTAKQKALLNPQHYFEHCFGVIRQFEPIRICFRAFWPQDAYLQDTPIHSSQRLLEKTDDYSDFEIYVRPTYDLKQELLWHRDKLAVLSPESFRDDMIDILRATLSSYETGENNAIDE